MKYPVLQVALDLVDMSRARNIAKEAVKGGVDWIEAGTPLIKSEGLGVVRELRKLFPDKTIIADMKVMDAGRTEVECAAKAGADVVCVLGAATDATIKECVDAGRNYGAKIEVDLIGVSDPVKRAKEAEKLGADIIGVHLAIDEQMQGKKPFVTLKNICKAVSLPVAIAGGINTETAADCLKAGASIIIAGGAITKSENPAQATKEFKTAISRKIRVASKFFKRADESGILTILSKVSASNVSDAMHRSGDIPGVKPLFNGIKIAGKAVTVRTYPGDWAKPVQAIDKAEAGDIIIIDAGGVGPAIWGELATQGAIQKKLAGGGVYGAGRDTGDIKKLKFPVFTKLSTPTAGEPKGLGEINIPIVIEGRRIMPGDWVVGDDDGICVIPSDKAVEIVNRAMHVLEAENRIRREIGRGSTLGKVTELLKWEKAR